jgi:hypothetical protein
VATNAVTMHWAPAWEATASRKTHESEDLPPVIHLLSGRAISTRASWGGCKALMRTIHAPPVPPDRREYLDERTCSWGPAALVVRGRRERAEQCFDSHGGHDPIFVIRPSPRTIETNAMYDKTTATITAPMTLRMSLATCVRRTSRALAWPLALAAVIATLPACDEEPEAEGHDLIGSWIDGFGFEHEITEDTWVSGDSAWAILEADVPGQVLFARNDDANAYAPGLYSRFDWTFDGDALYYCQTAYEAATLEAAKATPRADDGDLETGCAGFAWSSLDPY